MDKMTWKEARLKSGLKTSVIKKALGMKNNASLYSKEKRSTFTWREGAILCKLYNVSIEQIKL